ncbi:MAG: hypothetical protein A2X11_12675 [Bacteroidetes bacterium GWE2_42_24]|nr:MAG: hypothetical protein A2X11_12675 [Bacteroidetes bacterium GWE2_42_24]OFY30630.1 MAG: hypothetical protein A2X09_03925 [Bacteroidetes bacterium GWF2_43_11]
MRQQICTAIIFIAFFNFFSGSLFAQKPSWIEFDQRRVEYPESQYLVGYYSDHYNKKEPLQQQFQVLLNYARSEIIESIVVSVASITTLSTSESSQSYNQSLSQNTSSLSKAELVGLKTETWHDTRNDEIHAIAIIDRGELLRHYRVKLENKQLETESRLKEADELKLAGKKNEALTAYFECLPKLREMEEFQSIILGLQRQADNADLTRLEASTRKGIREILGSNASNLDEACFLIAESVSSQAGSADLVVKVFAPTYQETKMSSAFSVRVMNLVQARIASKGIRTSQAVNAASGDYNGILTGTYWKEGEYLRIIYTLRKISTNEVVASAESVLPARWLTSNGIKWLPENFEEAGERNKSFAKDELVGGGLHLEVWTNKGDENLLFQENEEMKIYVRVNRSCYLRFVYYLADGTRTLLFDDYFISADQANRVVELPETFICSEPFGIENMQVNALTKPFEPLNTVEQEGYQIISDGVGAIVAKTRGFKRASDQVLKAERRLTISTFPSGTIK